MTRDDIIRMAREAGLVDWLPNATFSDGRWWIEAHEPDDSLERFAALIAAAEREACAKVCEELEPDNRHLGEWIAGWCDGTDDCAAAIRARGEQA